MSYYSTQRELTRKICKQFELDFRERYIKTHKDWQRNVRVLGRLGDKDRLSWLRKQCERFGYTYVAPAYSRYMSKQILKGAAEEFPKELTRDETVEMYVKTFMSGIFATKRNRGEPTLRAILTRRPKLKVLAANQGSPKIRKLNKHKIKLAEIIKICLGRKLVTRREATSANHTKMVLYEPLNVPEGFVTLWRNKSRRPKNFINFKRLPSFPKT